MTVAFMGNPRTGDSGQKMIHDHALAMARQLIPHAPASFEPATSFLAVRSDRRVLGAVILHDYHPKRGCIEITAAAIDPRWASRSVLRDILRFIFAPAPEGLGCIRAQMAIPRKGQAARRARRFCQGIGFVYEGTARKGFGFDDAVCLSMLAEDAERWTGKIDHDQQHTVAA